jgi:hypothetical protein
VGSVISELTTQGTSAAGHSGDELDGDSFEAAIMAGDRRGPLGKARVSETSLAAYPTFQSRRALRPGNVP